MLLESSSSFLCLGVVNGESFNEVNDTILYCNWFLCRLAWPWDGVSHCFESFLGGAKVGGSFHFVLAVKTCCCSGCSEEVEVPSFGLAISGVDAEVVAAKEFSTTYNETFC